MMCLVFVIVVGMVGVFLWLMNMILFVVLYGIVLCLVFVVFIGIIVGMIGVEVMLNVIVEFIGGVWMEGNVIGMCFFKLYGYVICVYVIVFSSDLKFVYYVKILFWFIFCV